MLDNLFDSINIFIQDHAGAWWVLLVVFALCFIDGIIPPLPSESVVVALAAVAVSGVGEPNLALLFVAAAVGAFAGDQTAYTIGRHSPLARLAQGRNERMRKAMTWADRQLARRGAMIIIAARYIPVGRIAVNFTAGAIEYPRPKFIRYDAIAAITWAGYSIGIGALAGQWMKNNPLLGAVIAVCLAMVIGYLIDRLMQRSSAAPVEASVPEEGSEAEVGAGAEGQVASEPSAAPEPQDQPRVGAEAETLPQVQPRAEAAGRGEAVGTHPEADGTTSRGQGL